MSARTGKPVHSARTSREPAAHWIRGQWVMLEADVADLYHVRTDMLAREIQRDPARFPEDFVFQLTREEWDRLQTSYEKTLEKIRWPRKCLPYVFTAKGFAMTAYLAQNKHARQAQVDILRALLDPGKRMEGTPPESGSSKRIVETFERLRMALPWPKFVK